MLRDSRKFKEINKWWRYYDSAEVDDTNKISNTLNRRYGFCIAKNRLQERCYIYIEFGWIFVFRLNVESQINVISIEETLP